MYGDALSVSDDSGARRMYWQFPFRRDYVCRTGFLAQPTVFWRRRVYDSLGPFDSSLRFVPGIPARMLDTRDGTGGWSGPLGPGQSISMPSAPAGAAAVSGTLTLVEPAVEAHLTAHPCSAGLPPTASVNAARGGIIANSVTVGIDGGMCIVAAVESHVVYDTTGWWVS